MSSAGSSRGYADQAKPPMDQRPRRAPSLGRELRNRLPGNDPNNQRRDSKRFRYESHDQLRTHFADFMAASTFARRLKTLKASRHREDLKNPRSAASSRGDRKLRNC